MGTEAKNQNQEKQNKKKRKEIFPYGNYKNYYGYRVGQDLDEDPRLKVFRKEWFEDKDCLDIGCNNGLITIQIAKKFCCRSILGVDIDSDRVQDACWNLRKTVRLKSAGKASANASKLKVAQHSYNGSKDGDTASSIEEIKEIPSGFSSLEERDLFEVVSFRRENFVQSRQQPEKHYDTILCLSVTKWIHLNWGDDGLLTLFSKMWKLLKPGGILLLEPQPWKSYESNRLVSELFLRVGNHFTLNTFRNLIVRQTTSANYRNIEFRPEEFQDILLDKIGFRTVEDITSGLSGSKIGFNRPILVFQK